MIPLLRPLLALVLLCGNALACMNKIDPNMGPHDFISIDLQVGRLGKPLLFEHKLSQYLDLKKNCQEELVCNDLVVAKLYNKQYPEALELSTHLVEKFPDQYAVIMTHAAALELNGKFAEALEFMQKGLKINPHSHKDSEWIHVRIVQDRLQENSTHEHVLGLDFGDEKNPKAPKGARLEKTLEQLHIQLAERIHFIPEKDAQFASLLHDYADLLYLTDRKKESAQYYQLASDYGHPKVRTPQMPTLKVGKRSDDPT
jgi:hypothetical protein